MKKKQIVLFGIAVLAAGTAAACLVKMAGGAGRLSFDLRRDRPGDSFTGIKERERRRFP